MRKIKSKESMLKTENAITLIALIITIIVLLILAGVTIATLTGENGILTRASDAKEKTEQANKDEKRELAQIDDYINEKQTGIIVSQVTDDHPGILEGNGTDENPYTINSIEDLIFFAYNVTSGNTYAGEIIKLGLSLDFNSNKSYVDPFRTDFEKYGFSGELKETLNSSGFIPIGKTLFDLGEVAKENVFNGTFDGDGNVIYNIKINGDYNIENQYFNSAMFSINCGEIINLGVENAIINVNSNANKFGSIAILVGRNKGNIINCYTTGEVISINGGWYM